MPNKEEEEEAKLKQAEKSQHGNNVEQVENTEHIGTGAIKKETILPPVSNTRGRKKGGDATQKKVACKEKNDDKNSKP